MPGGEDEFGGRQELHRVMISFAPEEGVLNRVVNDNFLGRDFLNIRAELPLQMSCLSVCEADAHHVRSGGAECLRLVIGIPALESLVRINLDISSTASPHFHDETAGGINEIRIHRCRHFVYGDSRDCV